ncbi:MULTISPECIES: AzlD domain-containing protein [Staphylococcus]|uniref:AzlD domain-containing protein n=1 Tax=Staphylococcus hsinchuensis TaxID=3051183 RepID=A0ABZ3EF37_9STAP|nr:AzlD domain-containing protein [Staphylococcus sp. Marseille-Q6910]
MTSTTHILIIIVLCGLVTWLTRVIPFVLISKVGLSERIEKWLSFIPITLFTALVIDGVIKQHESGFGYSLNLPFVITVFPTIVVAFWTRSLTVTIIFGMLMTALIRIFM